MEFSFGWYKVGLGLVMAGFAAGQIVAVVFDVLKEFRYRT